MAAGKCEYRKREKCIPRYLIYMNACSNGIVDHVMLPDRQVQIYTCSCKGDSQLPPFMLKKKHRSKK